MGFHDKTFRRLMRERGVAEALLRERLPARLSRRLTGPPEMLAESFVDASMRGVYADVVLRAPMVGGEDAFVYCLVEHKRSESPRALMQVLDYVNALYQHLARTQGPGLLPTVVPMIIHNGTLPWRGPRRFSELLTSAADAHPYALDFEVILIDVAAEQLDSLAEHPRLRGALQGLRAASLTGQPLLRTVEKVLHAFEDDESTQQLFLRYLMNVIGHRDEAALRAAASQGRSRAMQTIAEFYRSQGRRVGLRRGRAEGRAEGRVEALRDTLRLVLVRRFKRVPARLEPTLASADEATLQRWLDAALSARSLRALFATH